MSFPYVISHEKLTLYLAILKISDLYLHEETIPELLNELAESIEKDNCVKHPIIVDKKSHVVLDGMHRVAASERLGCQWVPVCLVDYESPAVKVNCWYRAVKRIKSLEHFICGVEQAGSTIEETGKIEEKTIGFSPVVAAVKIGKSAFLVRSHFKSPIEAYNIIKRIEENLKKIGLVISYETESDALRKLSQHQVEAVLFTPRLTKKAIIDSALSGRVFAYKATRHIVPARPLCLNVPLSLLRDARKSLDEVNEELKLMLQSKRLKRVNSGSVFEGRRYEEDIYLFEE